MRTEIPPVYLDLVADATLKSYWRKRSLAQFLRRIGVPESFISTWQTEEETKRDFLYRLMPKLENLGDPGLRVVNRMADSLVEQTSFPDLTGLEDSVQKVKDATAAVEALRKYCHQQQAKAATEREESAARKRAEELRASIRAKEVDLGKLNDRLTALSLGVGSAQAGYDFQRWFYDLVDYFEIPNRKPYIVNGRQIDGSITVDGTTYLVELKFTRDQAASTDIDSLSAKVGSKADNTMGVMFSISGFSSTAVKSASIARGLLLLFDSSHLYMLLHAGFSLKELITRVRRHASQTGEAFIGAADLS